MKDEKLQADYLLALMAMPYNENKRLGSIEHKKEKNLCWITRVEFFGCWVCLSSWEALFL